MRHRWIASAGALALTAAAAAPAHAHVTLQPDTAPAGGFTRLDVRVPNERDEAGTTKVQVQFPAGFASVSTEPKPGWRIRVETRRAKEPIEQFGETHTEEVDVVTFAARKGTRIGPGEFVDFGLSLATPDRPGTKLTFKALQTYDNGEVVRWIGPPDAEEPAPQVELVAAVDGAGHSGAADGGSAGASAAAGGGGGHGEAAAAEEAGDGASTGLTVAALILGALGLIAGVAGLAIARRTRVVAV